jgi:hypothetical protein
MGSARLKGDHRRPAGEYALLATRAVARVVLASVVACLAVAGSPGCSRKPTDPVAALLAELEAAAEARDADRFVQSLSAEFKDSDGMGKPNAVLLLKRYFAAYEAVSIDVYGVETERGEGEARVRCIVEMTGRARKLPGLEGFLPPSAAYRFELGVADEGGSWRVRSARWESTEPPGEAP